MLIGRFLETVQRHGRKVAARDPFQQVTYAQLALAARALRRLALAEIRCERVGIMLPASVGGLATTLGMLWAGKTLVPLNFLLSGDELENVIRDAQIDCIIASRYFEQLLEPLPVRKIYLERVSLKRRCLFETFRRRPGPPEAEPDSLAAIVYTSGSTGEPRGVCLTHRNLMSNVEAAIAHLEITCDHHLLGILPPFHVFGLMTGLFLPVTLGTTITYIPRFSPQQVLEVIRHSDISIAIAIPSMYAALARMKNIDPADFADIELVVSGGEPLPAQVYHEMQQRAGVRLLEGYGMTETSPVIACNQRCAHKFGTVGRPLPGVEVRVCDPAGQLLATGQEGELQVRGPLVMPGYYRRPEQTAAVLDEDGWLHTGDIARIDEEGFIAITGRAKDLIIVGGENVYPREVERVLEDHPAVQEAVVFSRTDASRGEIVVACVTCKEGISCSSEDLRSFCRKRLAGYKTPRHMYILSELPRGPTGKVLKNQLKAQVGAGSRGSAAPGGI